MKIVQINSHFDESGAGKIVASIHKELSKLENDSYVFYGRGSKTSKSKAYKFSTKLGIYFDVFFVIHSFVFFSVS